MLGLMSEPQTEACSDEAARYPVAAREVLPAFATWYGAAGMEKDTNPSPLGKYRKKGESTTWPGGLKRETVRNHKLCLEQWKLPRLKLTSDAKVSSGDCCVGRSARAQTGCSVVLTSGHRALSFESHLGEWAVADRLKVLAAALPSDQSDR